MNRKTKRVLLAVLIVLNLAFIWGNSLAAGDRSSAMSGGVMDLLYRIFPFLPVGEGFHLLIRKLAHFSEFALLGLLCGSLSMLELEKFPLGLLGAGLAFACIDETIQFYVPGRVSSLLDVWIDSAGFAAGVVIVYIGYRLIKNKQVWRKPQ